MTTKPRFVLDTNLIVSASLFEQSFSRRVFETALKHGEILISDETQDEMTEVMMRPKFDRYIPKQKRLRFVASFLNVTSSIDVTTEITACRDPKDDKFLALAIDGNATCIITKDDDLLVLHPFCTIPILTFSQFMAQYGDNDE